MLLRGIKEEHPFEVLLSRQHKNDRLKMRVDEKQEGLVADRFAFETEHVNRISTQKHSDAAHEWRRPFFVAHLVAAGVEPHHIPDLRPADSPALEKLRTPKNRMIAPELNQLLREPEKVFLLIVVFPREPAQLVILAIRVVISVLRARPLVAGVEHRHTLREEQGC